jgi:hypothetical protein
MLVEQGDTERPWEFGLKRSKREWQIPSGYAFKLRMTLDGVRKINDAACTYTPGAGTVTYAPSATDVDTPGIYRAQILADTPLDRTLVLHEFEITIAANVP